MRVLPVAGQRALLARIIERHAPDADDHVAPTARESMAERLAVAFRCTRDGVWDWDLETCEVFYSERWKQNLGIDGRAVPPKIGTWLDLVHPNDLDALRTGLCDCLAGRASSVECECRTLHADGAYRWMLVRGEVVPGPNGDAARLIGTATDVTDSKRLRELEGESATRGHREEHLALDPITCVASHGLLELVESNLDRAVKLFEERQHLAERQGGELLEEIIAGSRQARGLVRWLIQGLLA